jgi:hypothetical protein
MRWSHKRFLLGQKGKPLCDDGSIVPFRVAEKKGAGFFESAQRPHQLGMMLPRSLPESPAIAGPEIFEYPLSSQKVKQEYLRTMQKILKQGQV